MIDASVVIQPGEDTSIRPVSDGRRAFVSPVASVQGELGVLTMQSRHSCEHSECQHPGNHHLPPHHRRHF